MATILKPLAATGSTGNVTGVGVGVDGGADRVGFQFVVEAVGSTPTVTYKYQGSLDGANWQDVLYVSSSSDTGATTTVTTTGVGGAVVWLDLAGNSRFYNQYRVVTTANTNVTFRAELWVQERDQ